jgi:hypothetical protein
MGSGRGARGLAGKTDPAYGPRQRRPVHGLFGGYQESIVGSTLYLLREKSSGSTRMNN